MKILFISGTNLSLGLAMRVDIEGHDVRYISQTNAGQGLVRYNNPEEQWLPDCAVYEDNNQAAEAESVRAQGFKVIGPTRWSSMVERDSGYRKQIIASLGWPTEQLNAGTHLYISGWFNGANYISSYSSIVYRRQMAGGNGIDLGCTGMLANFKGLSPKAYHTFLEPLENMLKKTNHRGCVHIHAVVDGDKFYVNEMFTSFMHPLSLLLYENSNIQASDIMLRLLDETSKPINPADAWASGIQLSIPPYPHTYLTGYSALVEGIVPGMVKHLWMADVAKDKDSFFTGNAGLVGYVTARGKDENECIRRMYRTISNIKIKDLQYRNDIGRNVQNMINNLNRNGWLV
jgi:phosphoribosylamine-glycine ligase